MHQKKWLVPMVGMCVFLVHAKSEQVMYGNIKLNDTVIHKDVKVLGMGQMKNARFEHDVTVYGVLNSSMSEYMGDVRVHGSDVHLTGNHVYGDVHVSNYIKAPKLTLEQTQIDGQVIFHGLVQGKVVMDANSQIAGGIKNGVAQ